MAKRRLCSKCESPDVARRPENGISPHPGYECKKCGAVMRPNGTSIMYVAMQFVSLGLAVFFGSQWFDDKADRVFVVLPIAAICVALFCLYELSRPCPKLVDHEDSSDHENS